MVKIEIINGFYKFYPQQLDELNVPFFTCVGDNLVRYKNYYTFSLLTFLNNFYLKGEKILGQIEATKNVLVDKNFPEQVLTELELCYNPFSQQIVSIYTSYSNLVKSENGEFLYNMPIVGYNIKQAVCYFDTQKQRIIF